MGIAEMTGIKLLISGEDVRPLTIHALDARNNEPPACDEIQSVAGSRYELFMSLEFSKINIRANSCMQYRAIQILVVCHLAKYGLIDLCVPVLI